MATIVKRVCHVIAAVIMCVTALPAHAENDFDKGAAVIFAYQRIGEDLSPSNNLSKDQFEAHLQELLNGDYHIAPLGEIVTTLQAGGKLPDRTVAITFDGAYKSALQNAIPLLLDKDIPFTVFFSPDQADANSPDYMNWDDIRHLSRYDTVTLGLHSADYTRLADGTSEEIHRQVNNALTRYRERLKGNPDFFAYPFGEYSTAYRQIIATSGFKAAFGQQSGVVYIGSDMMVLPRFAMTDGYADDDRFRMAAGALPFPVKDITPDDPRIGAENPPTFGFTVDSALTDKLSQLSCFISEQGKPKIQTVGKDRIELRVTKAFEDNRVRVNCTLPGPKPKPGEEQRWRWFGMLLSNGHTSPDDDSTVNNAAATVGSGGD